MSGAAEIFKIVAKIQTNAKTAIAELNGVHAAGKGMATKLKSSFRSVANFAKKVLIVGLVAAGAVAAGMFVSAVKKAAEFEQAMAMVKAVTGATGQEFADLEKKAKELGKTSKFTMTEIAEGMEFLGRAGFETTEIIDAMDGVTALAASQMMELGRAADITSNILTAFGLEADQAERVANVLAATAASANVNVEMLGETMKYVAPLAAAAGWSLEETAAAAGKLGDAGIQASMAGTSLRMAVASLMSPTAATNDALATLGLTIEDLKDQSGNLLGIADIIGVFEEAGADATDMLDIFGVRAGPALSILLNEGKESLQSYTGEITNTTAAFDQMAIQQDTLSGQTTILKGSWDLFMVTIGQKIIPHLTKLVQEILIPLVNRMVTWAEETDIIDQAMAKLNAGVKWMIDNGPMLITIVKGVGIAIAALGIAGLVMSLNPVSAIIIAISAAVTAAIVYWDDLKAVFKRVKDFVVGHFLGAIQSVVDKVTAASDAVKRFLGLNQDIGNLDGGVAEYAREAADSLSKLTKESADFDQQVQYMDQHIQDAIDSGGDMNDVLASMAGYVRDGSASYGALSEDMVRAAMQASTFAPEFERLGLATSQGFAAGMQAGQPDVEAAATGIADTAIDTVEEELEIKSPSQVMFDAGQEVGQGFADGISDMNDEVEDAVKSQTELIDEALGETEIGFVRWGKWVLNFTRELKKDTVDEMRDFVNAVKTHMSNFLSTVGDNLARNTQLRRDYEDERKRIMEGGHDNEADLLKEAEERYEENRKTTWEILKEGVRDFLKSLRQKLLLKAAEHTAIAIAQSLLLLPTAIGHFAAAAAYLAGGLGLAIAGFAAGGMVTGPVMGVVGEGRDNEVILPLNRSVLGGVGQGIVEAMNPASGMSPISQSSSNIEIHVAEGAEFHVREEADIDRIGRFLGDEFVIRLREEGLAPA